MGKKVKTLKAKRTTPPNHETLNSDAAAVIGWFDNFDGDQEHDFLSNFFMGAMIVLPMTWGHLWGPAVCIAADVDPDVFIEAPTGEHAFAAFKSRTIEGFIEILHAAHKDGQPSPGLCKGIGRKVKLRSDWEEIKYDVMAMVLRSKFTLERDEGHMLLNTGDALLIEGTEWNDRVWGVALPYDGTYSKYTAQGSPGRNWLGSMLMMVRAELMAEKLFGATSRAVYGNAVFVV